MLRFERKSRNQEVSISLRNREKALSRLSLAAFGIALGMHLMGFLIFHVAPFKISNVTNILPPVVVKSDLTLSSDPTVYAVMDEIKEAAPKIPKPVFSTPQLPSFPKSQNLSFDPGEL
jgi:hypothetical protein